MSDFIGRERELDLLNRYQLRDDASLLVVFGRRRVGKTSLLTHWLQRQTAEGLYWVAQPTSAVAQLRQFSQVIYQQAYPQSPVPDTFTYSSWDQALLAVADLAREKRFTLIIDEFTYLLGRTPELAGVFQNMWDHHLKDTMLLLVLCGSHLGMMQKHILSYQAPLYGRAAAQLHIQPLFFGSTKSYFPDYDVAQRVAIYAMFGGIPAYWERIDQTRTISDNIRQQLLTPNNLMQAEPRLLIQDFVREPDNYVALFNAIANGNRTQKRIIEYTGLKQGHVSQYLSTLEKAGFIERRVSITAANHSRRSHYHITDPYLRFYYRFLASRQSQLALGVQEPALEEVKRHLLDFIGRHTWEELCREWVLRAGAYGVIPFLPDRVGSFWNKSVEIDVVGINRMAHTLVLGECKWGTRSVGADVLQKLIDATAAVVPEKGAWRVIHVGFGRGGWTAEAQALAQETGGLSGKNWTAEPAQLFDLTQIDEQLSQWV